MEWIAEFQQTVGQPVVAFAREYWVFLAVAGMVCVWWTLGLFGRTRGDRETVGAWFGGDGSDPDGDSAGGDGD